MSSLFEYGYWLQALAEHQRNARLSRPQLIDLQHRKFRRLVAYAASRSPYYADLVRRLHLNVATCRPEDFPELTKSEVIERFDDLVTDRSLRRQEILDFINARQCPHEPFRGRYRILHTTGTTGTRAIIPYTPRAWVQASSLVTRVPFPRLARRRRIAALLPDSPRFTSVQLTCASQRGPSSWFADIKVLPIEWDMGRLIDELNSYQPDCVNGYVVHLKLLAEAQDAGDLAVRPIQVTTGGEQLHSHEREQIEAAFGVRLRNNYASTEGLYLGLSMEDGEGLYLQEDEIHFDVHPRHICITPLFNFTLPLIRYRVDDALTLEPPVDSALPFRRIRSVTGRQDWSLTFYDRHGRECSLTFPTLDRLSVPGVTALQAVQESYTSLTLRVQFSRSLGATEKRDLQASLGGMLHEIMQSMRLEGVQCRVCEVFDLHTTKTGKVKAMIACATSQPALRRAA